MALRIVDDQPLPGEVARAGQERMAPSDEVPYRQLQVCDAVAAQVVIQIRIRGYGVE
jgi:hypothetical protein